MYATCTEVRYLRLGFVFTLARIQVFLVNFQLGGKVSYNDRIAALGFDQIGTGFEKGLAIVDKFFLIRSLDVKVDNFWLDSPLLQFRSPR